MDSSDDPGSAASKAKLETMLSHLLAMQDGFVDVVTPLCVKQPLATQIETLKLQLRALRSPGRKLDGLRGVSQRCEKRHSKLMMDAKTRIDSETIAPQEHSRDLQQFEEELAPQQLLFHENGPAQLPPTPD